MKKGAPKINPASDPLVYKETEQCVVSIIVSSRGEMFDDFNLPFDAFGLPQIQRVALAAHSLYSQGKLVDQPTIAAELGPELATIGGMSGLSTILGVHAPREAFGAYKAILRDAMMLRKTRDIGVSIQASVMEPKANAETIIARALNDAESINPDSSSSNLLIPTANELLRDIERMRAGETTSGIPTGISWLDLNWGGLCEGGYYAIGGRPGAGKTALCEQIIANILNTTDHPVLVLEKDMSLKKFLGRMAARICAIPYWRFSKFRMNPYELLKFETCVKTLMTLNIILEDPRDLTADTLCAKVRKYKRTHGIKAAFMDHMQLLDVGDDLREGLTKASMKVRRMISDTGVPFVAIAQLNRNGGKGRPGMDSIKEFDQLAADVDAMTLLWAEEGAMPDENGVKNVIATHAKNREGGESDTLLCFDGERMCFSVREDDSKQSHDNH